MKILNDIVENWSKEIQIRADQINHADEARALGVNPDWMWAMGKWCAMLGVWDEKDLAELVAKRYKE